MFKEVSNLATQQEVMKNFMKSLDETQLSGRAAVDESIKSSSKMNYQPMNNMLFADFVAGGSALH